MEKSDREQGIECYFSYDAIERNQEKFGIFTEVSCGPSQLQETFGEPVMIRYAVCPVCHKNHPGSGKYYKIVDAISCVTGHQEIDPEEDEAAEKAERKRENAHAVWLFSHTIMKHRHYALISNSRALTQAFIQMHRLEDYVVINEKEDLCKVTNHQYLFLGKPTNYLTHPALEDPEVLRELERQEAMRDSEYLVKEGDTITPSDDPEGAEVYQKDPSQPVYRKI